MDFGPGLPDLVQDNLQQSPFMGLLAASSGVGSVESAIKIIQLSKSSSLEVQLNCSGKADSEDRRWAAVLLEEFHRWEGASVLFNLATLPPAVWTQPAPILRNFSLRDERPASHRGLVLDLFGGFAPRLRSLQLTRVALSDWTSPILHSLQSLVLKAITTGGPTLLQLAATLEQLPALKFLKLTDMALRGRNTPIEGREIQLRHLEELSILYLDEEDFIPLIKLLRAPNCLKYHFEGDDILSDDSILTLQATVANLTAGGYFRRLLEVPRHTSNCSKAGTTQHWVSAFGFD